MALDISGDEKTGNPWAEWNGEAILSEDKTALGSYYVEVQKLYGVKTDGLVPFPFFGYPRKAVVCLLLANPAYHEKNVTEHADPEFRKAATQSLRHEGLHPYLDDRFKTYKGYGFWRGSILKDVLDKFEVGQRQRVLERLMCVQLFPYHSKDFSAEALRRSAEELSSWEYSRRIVLDAVDSESRSESKLVVVMKAPWRDWLEKELGEKPLKRKNIMILDFKEVKQGRPRLTERNLGPDNFSHLVATLRNSLVGHDTGPR